MALRLASRLAILSALALGLLAPLPAFGEGDTWAFTQVTSGPAPSGGSWYMNCPDFDGPPSFAVDGGTLHTVWHETMVAGYAPPRSYVRTIVFRDYMAYPCDQYGLSCSTAPAYRVDGEAEAHLIPGAGPMPVAGESSVASYRFESLGEARSFLMRAVTHTTIAASGERVVSFSDVTCQYR